MGDGKIQLSQRPEGSDTPSETGDEDGPAENLLKKGTTLMGAALGLSGFKRSPKLKKVSCSCQPSIDSLG